MTILIGVKEGYRHCKNSGYGPTVHMPLQSYLKNSPGYEISYRSERRMASLIKPIRHCKNGCYGVPVHMPQQSYLKTSGYDNTDFSAKEN